MLAKLFKPAPHELTVPLIASSESSIKSHVISFEEKEAASPYLSELNKLFPKPLWMTILSYNVDDWSILYDEDPKLLLSMFEKEPELFKMIEAWKQINQMSEQLILLSSVSSALTEKRSCLLNSMIVLCCAIPAAIMAYMTAVYWGYVTPECGQLMLAEKFITENCPDFSRDTDGICDWLPEGIVINYNCTLSVVQQSNYQQLCKDCSPPALPYLIAACLLGGFAIIMLLLTFFKNRFPCVASVLEDNLSSDYLPMTHQTTIVQFLKRSDIHGLQIKDIIGLLKTALNSAITEWQNKYTDSFLKAFENMNDGPECKIEIENMEAVEKDTSNGQLYLDNVFKKVTSQNSKKAMNALIHGKAGYFSRHPLEELVATNIFESKPLLQ